MEEGNLIVKIKDKVTTMSDGRPRVIVTDCDHPSIEIEKEVLSQINPKFILAHCKTEDEVIEITIDADGIITQYPPITRRVIESLQKCKVIARYGAGANNIDVEAATEHRIIVANVPDYCIDEVSTHAIALVGYSGETCHLFWLKVYH